MRDKNKPHAVRIYEQINVALDVLRLEAGDDLEFWTNKEGNPRVGFHSSEDLPFGLSEYSAGFRESVRWMRKKLDLLVSTVHPRLKQMLRSKG